MKSKFKHLTLLIVLGILLPTLLAATAYSHSEKILPVIQNNPDLTYEWYSTYEVSDIYSDDYETIEYHTHYVIFDVPPTVPVTIYYKTIAYFQTGPPDQVSYSRLVDPYTTIVNLGVFAMYHWDADGDLIMDKELSVMEVI